MTSINPKATAASVMARFDKNQGTRTDIVPGTYLFGIQLRAGKSTVEIIPPDGTIDQWELGLDVAAANPKHPFVVALSELPDGEFAKVKMDDGVVRAYLYNKYAALFIKWDRGDGRERAGSMNGTISGGELQSAGSIDQFLQDCRTTMEPRDLRLLPRILNRGHAGILGDGFAEVDAAKLRLIANTIDTPPPASAAGALRKP